MQIVVAIILIIVGIILILAKKRIGNDDLARVANVASIIATIAGIIVFAFYTASLGSKEAQVIPMPSETLPPTLTLTSASTLTATLTPVSPETFGGLTYDCIPDLYWDTLDPKIIPDAKGCLPVSSWGLYAGDRELTILLDPQDVRESIVKTIFLPISGNVEISFDLTLEDIKDGSDPNAPPLFSVGICNPDKIKTAHNFISYNYPGDGSIGWGILNNDESRFQQYNLYTLNTPQSFVIKIDSFDLFIEDSKTENYIWTNPKVSPGNLQAFCIRYQMPTLGTLKVSISDLSIVEK